MGKRPLSPQILWLQTPWWPQGSWRRLSIRPGGYRNYLINTFQKFSVQHVVGVSLFWGSFQGIGVRVFPQRGGLGFHGGTSSADVLEATPCSSLQLPPTSARNGAGSSCPLSDSGPQGLSAIGVPCPPWGQQPRILSCFELIFLAGGHLHAMMGCRVGKGWPWHPSGSCFCLYKPSCRTLLLYSKPFAGRIFMFFPPS